MKNLFARFINNESGATAIEYGLIASLIAVAIIAVVGNIGSTLQATFGLVLTGLNRGNGNLN